MSRRPAWRPARLGGERALEQVDALLAARVAAEEDLGEPVERVDLLRGRLGVGAGELEHLVERARLLGGVAEGGGDARLGVERLGEPLAEDLDAAVQVRGAREIVRVLLERLTGAHQEVRDQRRIVLAAEPVDDRTRPPRRTAWSAPVRFARSRALLVEIECATASRAIA